MDFYWRDTMVVIPWYSLVIVGGLVLAVLIAVGVGIVQLFRRTRPQS